MSTIRICQFVCFSSYFFSIYVRLCLSLCFSLTACLCLSHSPLFSALLPITTFLFLSEGGGGTGGRHILTQKKYFKVCPAPVSKQNILHFLLFNIQFSLFFTDKRSVPDVCFISRFKSLRSTVWLARVTWMYECW